MLLENKRVLITGGTGSLGKTLVRRILSGELGSPKKLTIFSRDEAKQHFMRLDYLKKKVSTDEIIYSKLDQILEFIIGDIRDYKSIASALRKADVVINAAALKQVPACEYFPTQAVETNILGVENIIRAIDELRLDIETVVGVSTDKACKPVNVMGMTKAIQERMFIQANIRCPQTRFVGVRYGNVLVSRGSIIPLFHEQIKSGEPLTITSPDMTRFLLSLDQAVDIVFSAIRFAKPGEIYIPRVPSARIIDLAQALIGDRKNEIKVIGVRPGEKMHEILISEEELFRSIKRDEYYVVLPILPSLQCQEVSQPLLEKEFSSADDLLSMDGLIALLEKNNLMV
jgi:FlaA1/EpsC-like NDP-sugar epimerase